MKNRFLYTFIAMLLCVASANAAGTAALSEDPIKESVAKMTMEQKGARANAIKLRVEEIKSMDKSELSRDERKTLRKELRGLRKEAREIGNGGVYISLAGILIIILALILIL
jgi:uncharacterized membrane protein